MKNSADTPVLTATYHGSHGTSRSRYERISRDGFRADPAGRVRKGAGVYLWRKCRRWADLAKGWYRFRRSRGEYDGDRNSLGIVIFAVAEVPEDHYLDLSDQEALDQIDELADRRNIQKDDYRKIAAIYEAYILTVEEELGHEIDLYETAVSAPKKEFCPEYSVELLGSPRCYIVRKLEVLSILDVEEFLV